MNQQTTPKTGNALRDMITTPEAPGLVGLALLFFLSLAIIPLAGNTTVALIYAAAAVTALYLLSRSFSYVFSLLLPSAVLFLLFSSPVLPILFTALLLGSSCGTVLLLAARQKKQVLLWCAAPVLAYAAAYLLCQSPLVAALVLLPLPLAVAGCYLIRHCAKQTTAIVTLAAVLAVTLVVAGLVAMLVADMLHGNPLTILADALRSALSKAFVEAVAELRDAYANMNMELPLTEDLLLPLVPPIVNLLPGLFLAATVLITFFIWRADLNFILNLQMLPRIPLRMSALQFSPVTAAVYLPAFLVGMLGNLSHVTFAGTVALNFAIVLAPGLALVGYAALSPRRGSRRSCLSSVLFFGLILATVSNPFIGLALAALLGAVNVLLVTFMPQPKEPGDHP